MLIFKRNKKEDSENYRLVSLTLIPGKIIEQLILESISKHMTGLVDSSGLKVFSKDSNG